MVLTHSSPIGELKNADIESLQKNQDADNASNLTTKVDEPNGNPTDDETEPESPTTAALPTLQLTDCNQWDNSCVDCFKEDHCMAIRFTRQDENEFQCINGKMALDELHDLMPGWKPDLINKESDCPTKSGVAEPKQGNGSSTTEANAESTVNTTKTESSSSTTPVPTTSTDPTTTNQTTTMTIKTTNQTTSSSPKTLTTTTPKPSSPTTNGTSPTSGSSHSSLKPTTSKANPTPPPSSGGWSFWSFFGGILLTLGLFAIGFVGFKYYKARSLQPGGGLNYNRF